MPVNAKNVFVGYPDQGTTAAILVGDETDTIPAGIDDISLVGLDESGFASEEGVNVTPEDSTESIKDWSGAEIRRILTEFTGTVNWTYLEINPVSAAGYFGDDQVDVTAPTIDSGTQIRASLGKNVLPTKSWYFLVKDGQRRIVIFVPHGQVSERGEIPLNASGPVVLPVTVASYPDAAGQNIYIYTDDGVFSA
jgi:hypothetical protein